MNKEQTEYLKAKQALRNAWAAMKGEGTEDQWHAWDEAMQRLDHCEDELIKWGRDVAQRITTHHQNRANLGQLFERATKGDGNVRRRVIEMSLRLS